MTLCSFLALSVILATHNPFESKEEFLKAGWEFLFETPEDSDDRLAIVRLGDAQVMLGIDSKEFLPDGAGDFKGAGIDIYVEFRENGIIGTVYKNHVMAGAAIEKLEPKPWGVKAFHARICGYKFLLAGK